MPEIIFKKMPRYHVSKGAGTSFYTPRIIAPRGAFTRKITVYQVHQLGYRVCWSCSIPRVLGLFVSAACSIPLWRDKDAAKYPHVSYV